MNQIFQDHIREALRELSSLKVQKRLWLSTGAPGWSSLVEVTCKLFDDSGLGDALDRGEVVFGRGADDLLRELGQKLIAIDEHRTPEEIISDPAMIGVRELSRRLLAELFGE